MNATDRLHAMLDGVTDTTARENIYKAVAEWAAYHDDDGLAAMLERYEHTQRYRDHLTEEEARMVVDSFANFDGTRGAHWQPDQFFKRVSDLGGELDKDGQYNRWAAWAVTNMLWSDYGGVLRTVVADDRMLRVCWAMALALFTDRDREDGHGIRWYFGVGE